jgi:hypothetical protein
MEEMAIRIGKDGFEVGVVREDLTSSYTPKRVVE